MLYSGPPCTRLQGDLTGMLSVPRAVHRACVEGHRAFEAVEPIALEQADFERVHHPAHVREVLHAAAGGPQASAYAALATYSVESCSIQYAAACAALDSGFALALAGDFAGAGYGSALPSCLLNGLLVTAARLRDERRAQRVLIVDGNVERSTATIDTIDRLGLGWIEYLSLAGGDVEHDAALACNRVEAALSVFSGDLVLYQCGTDCCSSITPRSYMNSLHWEERHQQFAKLWATRSVPWVLSIGAAFSRSDSCILTERALRHFATSRPRGES